MNSAKVVSIVLILISLLAACGSVSTTSPTSLVVPSSNVAATPQIFKDDYQISMAIVHGGTFMMGSTEDQITASIKLCAGGSTNTDAVARCEYYIRASAPARQVTIETYSLDVYETTNTQYRVCVDAGVCSAPVYFYDVNKPEYPVHVDGRQAAEYCAWRGARLPDEAEWEYAARGPKSFVYPWGNEFNETMAGIMGSHGYSEPVGSNPIDVSWAGIHDLAGSLGEWVKPSAYSLPRSDGRIPEFFPRGGVTNFDLRLAYVFQGMWRGDDYAPPGGIYPNVPVYTVRCAQSG